MAKINVTKHIDKASGRICFTFSWEGGQLPDDVEKVNLSRHGTNPDCWFRPDQVHEHDYHSPAFTTESDAKIYLDRVEADIKSVLAGVNGQLEDQ